MKRDFFFFSLDTSIFFFVRHRVLWANHKVPWIVKYLGASQGDGFQNKQLELKQNFYLEIVWKCLRNGKQCQRVPGAREYV